MKLDRLPKENTLEAMLLLRRAWNGHDVAMHLAARYKVRALAVLTVSDHLVTHEALPSDQREQSFGDMVEIALNAAFA